MFIKKPLAKKLHLLTAFAMLSVSLLNVQTAYGYITPGGDSNRVTPLIPRPGSPPPGPIRPTPTPRPGNPRPYPQPQPQPVPRPTPRPTPRPIPIPYPGPVYPGPVYPGPVYPGPIYPSPVYPPTYPAPNYTQYKTVNLNRWVYGETFYVRQLIDYSYSYAGYRLKSVRIDVAGNASASVNLVVNGLVVDSRYTSGQDVYLYPGYYNDDLDSEIESLAVNVNGTAYIYSIVFELERRY